MRIVWSTLWFLDYRIPVFSQLANIKDVEFYLVYNKDVNPERINQKVKNALGDHSIPMTGELRLGKDTISGVANKGFRLPYQPGLIKTIKRLKPDVIVSDGFFQWTYAPLLLRATTGIPHVMCYEKTCHTERNAQTIREIYRKLVLKWIDVVCCSGQLCGEYVQQLGFNKDRITFGHMVADVDNLQTLTTRTTHERIHELKQNLGLSSTVYLYVGRMIELKGIMNLIKAWNEFTAGLVEKPSLLLVGSGEMEERIKIEIQNHKLDTVKMVGHVNYDEIADYYKVADIFILPTLEDNWSLVISEAMACRLPVITSIYNGCWPELVKESNGWVTDPLNHDAFVKTLQDSFYKMNKFKEMGDSSLEIISHFTPVTAAQSVFQSCLRAINMYK